MSILLSNGSSNNTVIAAIVKLALYPYLLLAIKLESCNQKVIGCCGEKPDSLATLISNKPKIRKTRKYLFTYGRYMETFQAIVVIYKLKFSKSYI